MPKQMKLRRWYASSARRRSRRSPAAKIAHGLGTKEDPGNHRTEQTVDSEFTGRVKGAQNHVEYDPGKRKPASPVVASEHECSTDNRQQLREFGPDNVLLQRQQFTEVVGEAEGAYQ